MRDKNTSIDIEIIQDNLVMTIWSPQEVLITAALHNSEKGAGSVGRAGIEHRTVKFDKQMSGKERNELVKATIGEMFL